MKDILLVNVCRDMILVAVMAVYKVPQDVEAEDKLVGPFGFRQFVYLLIAAGAGGLTFLFFKAPMPVPVFSVLTIPVIVVMLVLALPLRKDQPMEIYLAAVLRFMLKPKRRLWMIDGTASGVIIDAPAMVQRSFGKGISQDEALDQLSYLSRIVDTRGWAAKGVDIPMETSLNSSVASALADTEDVMDENTGLAKSFDNLIAKQKQTSRATAVQHMHELGQNPVAAQGQPVMGAPQPLALGQNPVAPSGDRTPVTWPQTPAVHPHFNPYPNMHQQILSPLDRMRTSTFHAPVANSPVTAAGQGGDVRVHNAAGQVPQIPAIPIAPVAPAVPEPVVNKDMTPPISPDIMRLANNNDLSIQAIANEAHRLEQHDGEVVIQLH